MTSIRSQPGSAVTTAILCAGLVTAQFIGGKAARDALYLPHLNVTTLPTMIIVTSAASIVLVAMSSKIIARLSPSRFVPALFATSAVLLLAEWALIYEAPRIAVVLVYLHISGLGPMLGSGFWLIAAERFDPRTAKKRFEEVRGEKGYDHFSGGSDAIGVCWRLSINFCREFQND